MKKILVSAALSLLLLPLSHAQEPTDAERGLAPETAGDLVSLDAANVTADELGRLLSRYSGETVTVTVADPETRFTIEAKNLSLARLYQQVAAFGAVVASASAPPAGGQLPEANVTLKLERVQAQEVAGLFGDFLRGSGFSLEASDPTQLVSLEVKHMPLRDLIPLLSTAASIHLRSR